MRCSSILPRQGEVAPQASEGEDGDLAMARGNRASAAWYRDKADYTRERE
ncbi:hypothetical protein ACSBM8_08215 [Sphingomonas sp. ASY06-1R]